jgi:POT family proton-dependent oligopeptide transporter
VYPVVGRFVRLTPQRKIGIGMFVLIPAFVIAAYVERRIVAGERPSVWWQLLAYAIVTGAEIMVSVPALEFAYTQAPKKMKSLIMAAYLAGSISFGNVIAGLVIRLFKLGPVAPHVTGDNSPNYYWAFVGLIAVAGLVYAIVASRMPVKDFIAPDVAPAPAGGRSRAGGTFEATGEIP